VRWFYGVVDRLPNVIVLNAVAAVGFGGWGATLNIIAVVIGLANYLNTEKLSWP